MPANKKIKMPANKKLKVRKFAGGGADMGDKDKAQERAAKGYGSTGPVEKPSGTGGNGGQNNQTKKVSTPNISAQKIFKAASFLSPVGIGKAVLNQATKMNRMRRAKGNMLLGGKQLPATRDFYRTTGKPLDVMTKEGVQYQKDAGLITDPKPMVPDREQKLCPDGTLPPCTTAQAAAPAQPKMSSMVSPSGAFNYRVLRKGGILIAGKPKLTKKGWK